MRFRIALALLVAGAIALTACDDKEKKLQEQVEALTLEIEQIDEQKRAAEADLDSIIRESEKVREEAFAAREFGQEQLEKLKAANGALYTARKRNNDLQRELDQWKARADSLAAENAQLKAKIAELNNRVAAAEQRAIEAEQRAIESERKLAELTAQRNNTYFVSLVSYQATNSKGEPYNNDKIPARTDILNIDVKLGRPEGGEVKSQSLKIRIMDVKGGVWFETDFTTANDQARVVVPINENKLKLNSGRYGVEIREASGASPIYSGSFNVG